MGVVQVFFGLLMMVAPSVISGVLCYKHAQRLNRNAAGWGGFGLFVPVLAVIIVFCMSPKSKFGGL